MGGAVEGEAGTGPLVGGLLGDGDGPVVNSGVGESLFGELLGVVEAGAGLRVDLFDEWDIKPGAYGKGLKQRLPPERWLDVERTYVGPDLEENWAALFHTLGFFREVAIEVGDSLGYGYPEEMDRRSRQYLATVVELDREAESFPFESRPVDAIAGPDLGPPRRQDSPHEERDPIGSPHPNGSS